MTRKRKLLAISALKGGVGKTTTAVNLAAAVARAGRRVLLVDADPQGSLASAIGLDPRPGLAEWLTGGASFDEVVVRESRPNLDVVTAGSDLLAAEDELREKGKEKRRHRLERRFASLPPDAFEVAVFDCPPSASLLLENAWIAATDLVIPVKLDYLSLPALDRTREHVRRVNEQRDTPLRVAGALPTFYDLRTHVSDDVLEALRSRFGRILSPIRINAALAEAPSLGQTIFEFDGSARGAMDYALLAEDLNLV